jgi:hypothetical protein
MSTSDNVGFEPRAQAAWDSKQHLGLEGWSSKVVRHRCVP